MAGGDSEKLVFATQNGLLQLLCVMEQYSLSQNVDFCLPPAHACVCLWCHDFRH